MIQTSKRFFLPILSFLFLIAACESRKSEESNEIVESYKVVGVKDGDTYVLLKDKKTITIRLGDIDCPEIRKGQPYGKAAKQFASDLCFGKNVRLLTENKSAGWGRIVGWIYVNDTICVNKELVKAGLAWQYDRYSENTEYAILEKEAQKGKIGLWADLNPIPPWEWRKKDK